MDPAQSNRASWAESGLRLEAEGLRLALFSGNYNYTRDGANQALNRLVADLESGGAVVRVYSPTTANPAFPPCGELVSAPSISLPGRPEYRLALGAPAALRRDVARFAPTLIHLSAPDLLGTGAMKLARKLGVPVVSSLHTRFETYLAYYRLQGLQPLAERYLYGFYRGCDRVLAPNAPVAELLASHGLGSQVRLWGRGVDRDRFSPARRDDMWRRSHGLADDEVAVLFFGRLVLEKGLGVFAETLAMLVRRGLRVRPLVVGDGPARGWFEARLPGGVFTGQLSGDALGRAVASADLLFNPSRTEAFGNVTLEAMAAGLPVVCPDVPSTRALVADGLDGVLCRTPSAAAYADILAGLAADPQMRQRLGRSARRTSASYDWTAASASVLDVYREVGGVPQPGRAEG